MICDIDPTTDEQTLLVSPQLHTVAAPAPYQSPYAPMAQQTEQHLAQVLQQQQQQQNTQPPTFPAMPGNTKANEEEDDEETIQLELQQIALERREIELKLKMRRLKQSKSATSITKKAVTAGPQSTPSTLYNPNAASTPQQPKRDSRSKKKIEESKRRTAERQERMLKDLERRSRRREHLTAEWVQSKDIWPLRAQSLLANLMHQYICYAFSQNNIETFEAIYRELYQLVDLGKGDWVPHVHDDMLRERMKRKMGQLRNKMQKTGEIVVRGDAYSGWQKAADYTGEAAGQGIGDETEMPDSMPAQPDDQNIPDDKFTYDAVAEHQALQHPNMAYGAPLMQHPGAPQYPMMPQQHHPSMMPYGQMDGSHQESMVM
ncbi:Hypothetical protein R9X50_00553800 [Acrodontium crateriforme]|uniref:Uncharacterized protein n=1 Tax=Acrodontium crateriforme TaxID=150365 RepID=A0AAQ3MCP1_9PEZI|nr:Hypothetical protein R9X50_00553800 [Acrodontium crateriforme]